MENKRFPKENSNDRESWSESTIYAILDPKKIFTANEILILLYKLFKETNKI